MTAPLIDNPWRLLRSHTPARIGLGRAGISQPTSSQLAFQLAHAQARDAVHRALDHAALAAALRSQGLTMLDLHSAASDRAEYLQRPDLGQQLDARSTDLLRRLSDEASEAHEQDAPELALIVADGLSALAVERHAPALIAELRHVVPDEWRWAPVAIVRQARVAIGDPIAHALRARLAVVLIGERPGLSSPDSLGIYLTWDPRPGRVDAERNCISNVRPEGLAPALAARRLAWLMTQARARGLTGVALKDESGAESSVPAPAQSFQLARAA